MSLISIFPDLLFDWSHSFARIDLVFTRSVVSLFEGLKLSIVVPA